MPNLNRLLPPCRGSPTADTHHGRIVQVEQLTIRVEGGDRAGESGVNTDNDHGAFPGTS